MLKMKAEKISDEVSFEIYFRRIEESKVSRNHFIYLKWKFLGYFFESDDSNRAQEKSWFCKKPPTV